MIDGIAATAGVIGVCAFPSFVSGSETPTVDELINHVVYIADRVGAEHLALGLDFANEDEEDYDYYGYDERYYPRPPWQWPAGLSWWEDVANLRPKLESRGFSPSEIAGIMGENFMRVLAEVPPAHAVEVSN